jgi:hypothetical protein
VGSFLYNRPMAGERASIFVGRPPEEVFVYLVELNDAEWRSGVLGMRLTSESYRGVGSTHVEVRRLLAWRVESPAEVVTYEPDRLWAVRRTSGPLRPQATYSIAPDGSGSRVAFGFGVEVLRGPARLLGPLARLAVPLVERSFRKDLLRLQERLEAAAPRG